MTRVIASRPTTRVAATVATATAPVVVPAAPAADHVVVLVAVGDPVADVAAEAGVEKNLLPLLKLLSEGVAVWGPRGRWQR